MFVITLGVSKQQAWNKNLIELEERFLLVDYYWGDLILLSFNNILNYAGFLSSFYQQKMRDSEKSVIHRTRGFWLITINRAQVTLKKILKLWQFVFINNLVASFEDRWTFSSCFKWPHKDFVSFFDQVYVSVEASRCADPFSNFYFSSVTRRVSSEFTSRIGIKKRKVGNLWSVHMNKKIKKLTNKKLFSKWFKNLKIILFSCSVSLFKNFKSSKSINIFKTFYSWDEFF